MKDEWKKIFDTHVWKQDSKKFMEHWMDKENNNKLLVFSNNLNLVL